jgi:hypothetical protein
LLACSELIPAVIVHLYYLNVMNSLTHLSHALLIYSGLAAVLAAAQDEAHV